jgi:hypothetical protein
MLVQVLSFGTNWWARFGRNADDPHRFTRHAAYYNSTGVAIRFAGIGSHPV